MTALLSAAITLPKVNPISAIPMISMGWGDSPIWDDAGKDPQLAFDIVWAMYHADIKSCPNLDLCQHPESMTWEGL